MKKVNLADVQPINYGTFGTKFKKLYRTIKLAIPGGEERFLRKRNIQKIHVRPENAKDVFSKFEQNAAKRFLQTQTQKQEQNIFANAALAE